MRELCREYRSLETQGLFLKAGFGELDLQPKLTARGGRH